jgi:hypothetical protein
MMSERIDDAPDAPAIRLVNHRPQTFGFCGYGAVKNLVGIVDNQDHAN